MRSRETQTQTQRLAVGRSFLDGDGKGSLSRKPQRFPELVSPPGSFRRSSPGERAPLLARMCSPERDTTGRQTGRQSAPPPPPPPRKRPQEREGGSGRYLPRAQCTPPETGSSFEITCPRARSSSTSSIDLPPAMCRVIYDPKLSLGDDEGSRSARVPVLPGTPTTTGYR